VVLGTVVCAKAAGFTALVVTIDISVAGFRERDFRNGVKELLSGRPFTMLPFVWQVLARPRWLFAFLADGGLMQFPNIVLREGPMPYADVGAALEQSATCWDDLRWIREAWSGPVVVKGVHTADDARGPWTRGERDLVSNHGAPARRGAPTLRVLPEIVTAVGGHVKMLLDGGIHRGSDVVKALCLGARAVLVGRAYVYGLAVGGEKGVARVIGILRADLVRTFKLLGCFSVSALDAFYVSVLLHWRSEGG
jgi:L-lactate dehydrogenase (cytochrome)